MSTRISQCRVVLIKDFNATDYKVVVVGTSGNGIVGDSNLSRLSKTVGRCTYNMYGVPELIIALIKILGYDAATVVALLVRLVVIVEFDGSLVAVPLTFDVDILVGGLGVREHSLGRADYVRKSNRRGSSDVAVGDYDRFFVDTGEFGIITCTVRNLILDVPGERIVASLKAIY